MAACGASSTAGTRLEVPAYLLGTLGNRTVDVRDVCRSGAADEVALTPNAKTVALGVLTLGIYTPLELRVTCRPETPRAPVAPQG
jgi:hypothetical protein